jgi:menaquinone C8-methyltransferase
MYLIEPLLNIFYRSTMRSVLRFGSVEDHPVPPRSAADTDDYLLYVHIPFCETLCPYCSFHRYSYDEARSHSYFDALLSELAMYKNLGYDFKGMYIGGGTPTIAMDRLLEMLTFCRQTFSIREISVETNPNHMTDERLRLLKDAGVNRLSVGVQSFDDRILKAIGRLEKYGSGWEIQKKLRDAQGIFDTLNVDLIFNMPMQDDASLRADLDIIDELFPDQVTFYPLMTAPSVEAALRSTLGAIDFRKEKRFYFTILERMLRNYTGSTAWCFSRKKSMIDEYIIAYDKYIGAGSGSFGYFNDCIYITSFSLEEYIAKINKGELPITRVKKFTPRENRYYFFLMKLFGLELDKAAFEKAFGRAYTRDLFFETLLLRLARAIRETDATIQLTGRGRYYWVMAMREFFIAVDTMRDACRNQTG